ncbi:unnamed protein product [Brassica oleracea var. botrytis]|uniref:Uncharacterized protein n=1 Tax=Brassica oleracea TaxID=3712 RepID=A0A3P6DZF2_BRAOL|nr:unnamed protein product [Brassica oleracea]
MDLAYLHEIQIHVFFARDFMTIIYIRNHRTLVWLEKVPKELIPCYNRNRETGPTAVQRFVLYEIIMGRRTIKRMKPLAE